MADDALEKGSAGRAEAAVEVDGEERKEVCVAGTESMVLFGFCFSFFAREVRTESGW